MAAILVGLAACGGGGGSGGGTAATTPPDPNSAAVTLDAAGGQVATPSGVNITVPAGALVAGTTIRIAKDSTGAPALPADPGLRAVGDMLALTPHGSAFSSDVSLSVPAPEVTLAANEQLVLAKAQPGGQWELLPTTRDGDKLVAQVRSFSYLSPVVVSYPMSVYQLPPLSFGLSGVTCNGAPCGSMPVSIDPVQVKFNLTSNGGQVPNVCGTATPTVQLSIVPYYLNTAMSAGAVLIDQAAYAAGATPYSVTLPAPIDHFWITLTAKCQSSVLQMAWAYGSWNPGSVSTTDQKLWVAQWPSTLTGVAGVPLSMTALLTADTVNLYAVPSGGSTFFFPTDDRQARTEWQRSDDGGSSWRSVGFTRQIDGQSSSINHPTLLPWQYWTVSHGISPTTVDNGSRWRLQVCWIDISKTTPQPCVTSNWLTLTVLPSADPPGYSQQPRDMAVLAGQTASFTAVAQATPAITGWQWQTRPANSAGAWSDIAGANSATYTTPLLGLADNGTQYRALATNAAGSTASDTVTAAVNDAALAPSFTAQPLPLAVITGSEAVFAVAARGTEGLSYQWRKNGAAIAGANASTLKLPATTLADAGTYSVLVANAVGSITSQDATLTVSNAAPALQSPRIVQAPASLQVHEGDGASLGVNVSGSSPLTYQWLKDGTPIPGATLPIYVLAAVTLADAGGYRAEVSNSVGGLRSAVATLTVLPMSGGGAATAPNIDTPPATLTVTPGQPATLAVGASGTGPLNYQWSHDGADIPGATSAALTLPFVTASDAGTYRVRVTNSVGTVLSSAAQLIVVGAPAITADLADISVPDGGNTSFSVTATGDVLHYVWLYNGEPYAGSTDSPTLSVPVTLADTGSQWRVLAFNGAGIAFSRTATLTVTPAPGCTGPNNTGWCRNPVAASLGFVAFGSANVGLAIESYYNTQVLRTTDGGVTWTPQEALHTTRNFYAYGLAFADANTAILTGLDANSGAPTILRSTDAGLTWTQVYTSAFGSLSGYIQAPVFINASVGLVPANRELLRTTDGGATWSVITLPTGQWLNSLAVLPSGAVLGQGGDPTFVLGATTQARLLRSNDGGQTWGVWGPPTSGTLLQYLAGMSFVDDITGMAVINAASGGVPARLARTTDGGHSWTVSDVAGTSGTFSGVTMAADGTGVAMNGNVLMRTADAGATWQAVNPGTAQGLASAAAPSPGVFVVVGDQVILRNTQGGTGP